MSTVNPKIFGFYERTGDLWWSDYRIHFYQTWNQIRVPYFVRSIAGEEAWQKYDQGDDVSKSKNKPLRNMRILEVGCGGGHLTEAIGKLGPAKVIGIDPVEKNCIIAEQHLQEQDDEDLKRCVEYQTILLEDFVKTPANLNSFDGVIITETFEHLDYEGVDKLIEMSNQVSLNELDSEEEINFRFERINWTGFEEERFPCHHNDCPQLLAQETVPICDEAFHDHISCRFARLLCPAQWRNAKLDEKK